MPWHRITKGECLHSLAWHSGLAHWQTIYDHPENTSLTRTRPHPGMLKPGDQVFIPPSTTKDVPAETDRRHRFVLRFAPVKIRLVIEDSQGRPLADRKYALEVHGLKTEGRLGDAGLIDVRVRPDAEQARLEVWVWGENHPPRVWTIKLGQLEPCGEVQGIKARLHNFGLNSGGATDKIDASTRSALAAFQQSAGLRVTGELDAQTRKVIDRAHDEYKGAGRG